MEFYPTDDAMSEAAAARRAPPTRRHLRPEVNDKLTLVKIWLKPYQMRTLRTLANRSGHTASKAAKHLLKNSMSYAVRNARDSSGISGATEVAGSSK